MSKNLPRILCIGAQKAGTSWLYENLRTNPAVWSPPFKELHFFDYKFVEESKRWARWHVRSNIKKTLKLSGLTDDQRSYLFNLQEEPILNGNWYKKAFSAAPAGSIGLDVTPEYCAVPERGIEFIRNFLSVPLIIYIIRDPVERALSQIRMNMYRKKQNFEDPKAWMDAAVDPVVAARGDYRTYVPRWDKVFPDIFYAPFGAITEDPHGFLRSIEDNCGLPHSKYENANRRIFASVKVNAPTEVVEYLQAEFDGQVAYLRERFGSEFVRKTV